MMQLKAIFSVLLQGWVLVAAQPLDSYRNDHSKMVVTTRAALSGPVPAPHMRGNGVVRIAVDRDLCRGHAASAGEAPTLFSVSKQGTSRSSSPTATHALSIEED
jgi:sterol 14alpha-demethylase